MTPQQKAKEIAKKYEQYGCECIPHDCEEAAMQMHEWDKEQFIDRLEDWLANNICNAYNFNGDDISATFMNDCIKVMKGE